MLVNGSAKAMALHCAIEEPISHKCTASGMETYEYSYFNKKLRNKTKIIN
jgi:6-phosphogluconolactonase/glucosamine-6-phosphate isomerase/deaminase